MLINRTLRESLKKQQQKFPILAITGPRQSGKTTLLKNLFPEYQYLSLENPDTRSFAAEDPNGFLKKYNKFVMLDEVQRVPELFSYLQTKADESKEMGRYILSGSQNFHLVKNITQTLAGRIALFKLLPLDFHELKSGHLLSSEYEQACYRGFYPAIYDREIDPAVFYHNYLQTYIEKDVTELINIRDLAAFRIFIATCANRSGQLLNLSAVANECDIAQPTAKAWLSVLESSYIIFLLQPYHKNFNKRLIKSPKLYFYDVGLLCYLLGIRNPDDLTGNRLKGNIFETMIVAEFQKKNHHMYLHKDYYFWQDSKGREVDLLTQSPTNYIAYEIKATQTISSSLFKNLDTFEEIAAPGPVAKKLIYGGLDNQKRTGHEVISWRDC